MPFSRYSFKESWIRYFHPPKASIRSVVRNEYIVGDSFLLLYLYLEQKMPISNSGFQFPSNSIFTTSNTSFYSSLSIIMYSPVTSFKCSKGTFTFQSSMDTPNSFNTLIPCSFPGFNFTDFL